MKSFHWKQDLFGVDDQKVLDVGLLALLVEEEGELVAHPDPVVVLHLRNFEKNVGDWGPDSKQEICYLVQPVILLVKLWKSNQSKHDVNANVLTDRHAY